MPVREIIVKSIRLDAAIETIGIEPPQFVWMDCQGSELAALKSLGKYLSGVQSIWAEYLLDELYSDVPLFDDVAGYLEGAGFNMPFSQDVQFGGKAWFGDGFFVRKSAA
jgi:hypothetical protein